MNAYSIDVELAQDAAAGGVEVLLLNLLAHLKIQTTYTNRYKEIRYISQKGFFFLMYLFFKKKKKKLPAESEISTPKRSQRNEGRSIRNPMSSFCTPRK